MKFSLFYLPADTPNPDVSAAEGYRRIIAEVVLAEELGFDVAWLAEHHFSSYGGIVPSVPVLGTALAAKTGQIRIGAAAAILPLRDAVETAESFAMLDVLSGGRLEFGVGRGFLPLEFTARGLALQDRTVAFQEALEVVLAAWGDGQFSYAGNRNTFHSVEVLPKPVQRPHPPVWIAASTTRESFEFAGRNGFHLLINPYNRTSEELAAGIRWYHEARRQAGYDRSTARITANQHLFVAAKQGEAEALPREPLLRYLTAVHTAFAAGGTFARDSLAQPDYGYMYPDRVLFGTPESLVPRISKWAEWGVTDLCFMTQFGHLDPNLAAKSLRLFASEVMPCFR